MKKKEYCTQNDGHCPTCSLVNYGRDCMNNPVDYAAFAASALGKKGRAVNSPAQQETARKNGAKGGAPRVAHAETWKGNKGQVEQFYTCPYCGREYRLSQMDEIHTGPETCGDDGLGGIEDGCGKKFIVKATDPR